MYSIASYLLAKLALEQRCSMCHAAWHWKHESPCCTYTCTCFLQTLFPCPFFTFLVLTINQGLVTCFIFTVFHNTLQQRSEAVYQIKVFAFIYCPYCICFALLVRFLCIINRLSHCDTQYQVKKRMGSDAVATRFGQGCGDHHLVRMQAILCLSGFGNNTVFPLTAVHTNKHCLLGWTRQLLFLKRGGGGLVWPQRKSDWFPTGHITCICVCVCVCVLYLGGDQMSLIMAGTFGRIQQGNLQLFKRK